MPSGDASKGGGYSALPSGAEPSSKQRAPTQEPALSDRGHHVPAPEGGMSGQH